jgi:hypothetical protein
MSAEFDHYRRACLIWEQGHVVLEGFRQPGAQHSGIYAALAPRRSGLMAAINFGLALKFHEQTQSQIPSLDAQTVVVSTDSDTALPPSGPLSMTFGREDIDRPLTASRSLQPLSAVPNSGSQQPAMPGAKTHAPRLMTSD